MRHTGISERKTDHIRICRQEPVQSRITTGLEAWRLVHQALPELDSDDLTTEVTVLGKTLRAPFFISAMTGGTTEAADINRNLALAAQKLGLAMVLGSQRPAIEDPALAHTYCVREWAPDVLLFANLGAVQLNQGYGLQECLQAVEMVGADGLALHLNPLQEMLQPEGDRSFRGLAAKIAYVVKNLGLPVLVKEVGWGLSERVARALWEAGVRLLDVAGAGGTSWSEVESLRANDESTRRVASAFADWGIPTADSIQQTRAAAPDAFVIASGGIRTGVEAAKAIALGADAVGFALPLLEPACRSAEEVIRYLQDVTEQLRLAMLCSGSQSLADLRHALRPASSSIT
ncbi:MAG: type 2 isopentenyl-diphosphate Delta-isomerase [Anaerolineae bacterium]|nr:type 2 isopentenyl-diphosphate Delta-isomerase [Anaerolineae bacterium]